jgi:glucans biosynthesis protein
VNTWVSGQNAAQARFVIDFQVPHAEALRGPIELELSAPGSEVLARVVQHNPHDDHLRARFELKRSDVSQLSELRAFLRVGSDVLTETWSYPWQPSQ